MCRISQEKKIFLENLFLVQFLVIFEIFLPLFDTLLTKDYYNFIDLSSPMHFCPYNYILSKKFLKINWNCRSSIKTNHCVLWEEFLPQWEDISLIIWFFRPRLWLTFEEQKRKFAVRSRLIFFSNFGHFSASFNLVFYSHFKNIIFFFKSN